jgi:hypothetical protein
MAEIITLDEPLEVPSDVVLSLRQDLLQGWVAADCRIACRAVLVVVDNAILHGADCTLSSYANTERKCGNRVCGDHAGPILMREDHDAPS